MSIEPIMKIDIDIGDGKKENINVGENDDPKKLISDFCYKYGLTENYKTKLLSKISKFIEDTLIQKCSSDSIYEEDYSTTGFTINDKKLKNNDLLNSKKKYMKFISSSKSNDNNIRRTNYTFKTEHRKPISEVSPKIDCWRFNSPKRDIIKKRLHQLKDLNKFTFHPRINH